ncbi:hypothetical protein UFOVP1475_16 [uncultured Caudovirales phage]|jgi:hypothetical protein|uniref:Uncharacterized protein n=1 Tax=uncultured Caudovirales phage TaxID=2100421 RepID=A0A6J5SL40_9CAUD|nr:hypothetical protein UFOVP1475_16 [uncultured Caudovirales phage]
MVEFNFAYSWLKDKHFWLGAGSNVFNGILIIADEDGTPIKYYYYEEVNYKSNKALLK